MIAASRDRFESAAGADDVDGPPSGAALSIG